MSHIETTPVINLLLAKKLFGSNPNAAPVFYKRSLFIDHSLYCI